jgi:transposase-like protein
MSKTTNKFSPEVRERAVRLVLDSRAARAIGSSGSPNGQHGSRWQAILSISSKIGCAPQTLNDWVNKAEVNNGKRAGVSSEMGEKMKALERGNRELRRLGASLDVEPGGGGDGPSLETGPAYQHGFQNAEGDVGGLEDSCGDAGQGAEGDGDHQVDPRGAGPFAARAGRPDRPDG